MWYDIDFNIDIILTYSVVSNVHAPGILKYILMFIYLALSFQLILPYFISMKINKHIIE